MRIPRVHPAHNAMSQEIPKPSLVNPGNPSLRRSLSVQDKLNFPAEELRPRQRSDSHLYKDKTPAKQNLFSEKITNFMKKVKRKSATPSEASESNDVLEPENSNQVNRESLEEIANGISPRVLGRERTPTPINPVSLVKKDENNSRPSTPSSVAPKAQRQATASPFQYASNITKLLTSAVKLGSPISQNKQQKPRSDPKHKKYAENIDGFQDLLQVQKELCDSESLYLKNMAIFRTELESYLNSKQDVPPQLQVLLNLLKEIDVGGKYLLEFLKSPMGNSILPVAVFEKPLLTYGQYVTTYPSFSNCLYSNSIQDPSFKLLARSAQSYIVSPLKRIVQYRDIFWRATRALTYTKKAPQIINSYQRVYDKLCDMCMDAYEIFGVKDETPIVAAFESSLDLSKVRSLDESQKKMIMLYLCRPIEDPDLPLLRPISKVLSMEFTQVAFSSKEGVRAEKANDIRVTGKSKDPITVTLLTDTIVLTRKDKKNQDVLLYPPMPILSSEILDRESKSVQSLFELKVKGEKLFLFNAKNRNQKIRFFEAFLELKEKLQKSISVRNDGQRIISHGSSIRGSPVKNKPTETSNEEKVENSAPDISAEKHESQPDARFRSQTVVSVPDDKISFNQIKLRTSGRTVKAGWKLAGEKEEFISDYLRVPFYLPTEDELDELKGVGKNKPTEVIAFKCAPWVRDQNPVKGEEPWIKLPVCWFKLLTNRLNDTKPEDRVSWLSMSMAETGIQVVNIPIGPNVNLMKSQNDHSNQKLILYTTEKGENKTRVLKFKTAEIRDQVYEAYETEVLNNVQDQYAALLSLRAIYVNRKEQRSEQSVFTTSVRNVCIKTTDLRDRVVSDCELTLTSTSFEEMKYGAVILKSNADSKVLLLSAIPKKSDFRFSPSQDGKGLNLHILVDGDGFEYTVYPKQDVVDILSQRLTSLVDSNHELGKKIDEISEKSADPKPKLVRSKSIDEDLDKDENEKYHRDRVADYSTMSLKPNKSLVFDAEVFSSRIEASKEDKQDDIRNSVGTLVEYNINDSFDVKRLASVKKKAEYFDGINSGSKSSDLVIKTPKTTGLRPVPSFSSLNRDFSHMETFEKQISLGMINQSTVEYYEKHIENAPKGPRELNALAASHVPLEDHGKLFDTKMILDIRKIQDHVQIVQSELRSVNRENQKLKKLLGDILRKYEMSLQKLTPSHTGFVATQVYNFHPKAPSISEYSITDTN